MNDIDDALRRYAAATPDLDPREGLAERMRRHERRRRATVAGIACFAALVAGSGVAALSSDRTTAGLTATDPTPTVTASASPSPSEEPSPEPEETEEPATPSPTRTPSPEPEPVPTAYPTAESFGGEGLVARVALTPDSPATATTATLRVTGEDDDGGIQVSGVSWGDGSSEPIAIAMPSCAWTGPPPTTRPKDPGTLDASYRHAWRHDGTYTVVVDVVSDTGCAQPPGRSENARLRLRVEVREGEIVSNGPRRPAAHQVSLSADGTADGNYDWALLGFVDDADGWLGTATVDWGDGSQPDVIDNNGTCDDGDGRHYPSSHLSLYSGHDYEPGTYTITVSWTSTGCDGEDAQTGSTTVEAQIESVG